MARSLQFKIGDLKWKAEKFYKEHKEFVIAVAPVVIGGAVKIGQYALKQKNVRKQQKLKDCYIYDRSEGHYWELKRPLRRDEWVYVSRERNNGRCYADILLELGILR